MARWGELRRAGLVFALLLPACALSRSSPEAPPPAPPPEIPVLGLDGRPDSRPDARFVDEIRRECSACHLPPAPADLPRGLWRQRIHEMARFSLTRVGLGEGGTSRLASLELSPFISYFEERAPEALAAPPPWPAASDRPFRFRRRLLAPPGAAPVPLVVDTRLLDLDADGKLEVVASDLGHGVVLLGAPQRDQSALREIAEVPNPARVTMADLDGDGRRDLLVADAGSFRPEDHEKGALVWLRADGRGGFESRVLAEGLARVSDVEAADFDGDGDLDLVVAANGLHARQGIWLYLNQTTDGKEPRFVATVLDERAGAIQVDTADLDSDGRADFVALIGRQHQTVVAFLNRGAPAFEQRVLFTAPTPAWGATGIDVVDLDRDSDKDIVMTNGDTLADATVKPYHGVVWLENRGGFPFARHDLAALPGAYRARAADLDGDGDLDVAVAAFLPDPDRVRGALTSLGLLEQTRPGVFERRALQAGQLSHLTLDLGDQDGDGDVDLVTGNLVGFTFARTGTGFSAEGWVELWENLRRP